MRSAFDNSLRRARRRWDAARAVNLAAVAALVIGAALAAAVLAERAFGMHILTWYIGSAMAAAPAAVVLLLWFWRRPTPAQVALAIDERAALRERFSTALALATSGDPFAQAAVHEAHLKAEGLNIGRHFPITVTRRWAWAASAWAVAGLAFWLMPPLDLLGHEAAAKRLAAEEARAKQAEAEVKRTVAKAETIVRELNMAELAADLARLGEERPELASADMRREAIRKLGEVADRLQQAAAGERGEATRTLQDLTKQLRIPSQGLSRQMSLALARGRFSDAAKALQALRDKLAQKEMTPEQRAALEKDLANLARQLESLAARNKELEDALKQAGLNPDLAKLSPDALADALQKSGLDSAAIQKLLAKAQACRMASQACKSLAAAMGQCAGSGTPGEGLSPEAMEALAGQLSELEAMQAQLAGLQAAIDELRASAAGLGEGLGLGGAGPWAAGQGRPGAGTGGPGQGSGPQETGPGEGTNTLGTRAKTPTTAGPIIATWTVQEEQVRGESRREFQDALQAGRDRAAEAVSENVIPSRYHEAVKKYFGGLGQPEGAKEPAK